MEYTDAIQEYMDGTLSPEREEQLFSELSGNEELRADFKQQLAIKEAIKADKKAFTPSPNSTLNVFTTLGFAVPPIAGTAVATAVTTGAKTASVFSRFSQAIYGGLISAAATTAVIMLLTNPFASKENDQQNNRNLTEVTTKSTELVSGNTQATIQNQPATPAPVKTKTIVKYVYITKDGETKQDLALANKPINNEINLLNTTNLNDKIEFNSNYKVKQNNNKLGLKFDVTPIADLIGVQKDRFTFEYMGTQPWNISKATINPSNYSNFNNSQMGLFYNLNDNLSIGLDLRQETFFQVYEGKDESGKLWRYEQQPNFTSFGTVLRYRTDIISSWLQPIGQIYLGATNVGMIGRGMIGAEIRPYFGVSFTLGLEYSDLVYAHQNSYFNSGKLGVKYGMGISF